MTAHACYRNKGIVKVKFTATVACELEFTATVAKQMKYKATEKNEGTYLMREDEVEDNGNGVLWSMLLFFFSGFRVLILWFFLPRPLLCFFFVSVPCVIRLPLVLCFQCSSSCSFSLFRYLPLRFCLRFSAPVFCFVLPWVLSLVFL